MRRHGYEKVDVIFRDVASDDLDVVSRAYFTYQISGTCANGTDEYWLLVFSSPNYVVL